MPLLPKFLFPVCCRSAWKLSDVFRSSEKILHVKTAGHNSVPTSQLHHYVICHKLANGTEVNLRNKEVPHYVCKAFVADPVKRGFYVSRFYVFLNSVHFFYRFQLISIRGPYIFLEFTSVLLTHSLDFGFKLSIICPVVVILTIFYFKPRKEIDIWLLYPASNSVFIYACCLSTLLDAPCHPS